MIVVAAHVNRWAATLLRALVLMAALVGTPGDDGARAQTTSGDAVAKAKFTITIARFVQWPSTAPSSAVAPLKICVLHNSPALGAAFAAFEGQPISGRAVNVMQNPRDSVDCGLMFIDTSVAHRSVAAIAAVTNLPVLTLGAVDGFLSQGGMIELTVVNDSLRFDINLRALRGARMEVSSQVIQLARQVRN